VAPRAPVATTEPSVSLPTRAAISRQRRVWTRRASAWDHHGGPDLERVVDAVLERSEVRPGQRVLDIGCGTGALSVPLAERGAEVTAVDVSQAMVDAVADQAAVRRLPNVHPVAGAAEALEIEPGSFDAVVSNYALHHLRDADKSELLRQSASWLRPGGVIVIGDMMFGRGGSARDRQIIRSKVWVLVRKGPGGLWRVVKNAFRFLLRLQERPVSIDSWVEMLEDAGFVDVEAEPVVAEAAVVRATAPPLTVSADR